MARPPRVQDYRPIESRVPVDPDLARPPVRSRHLHGCFRIAAGLLLLVSLFVAWLWLWPTSRQIERRWLERAGFDPRVVYPDRLADDTARRLEELAASLGLRLALQEAPGRAQPSEQARTSFASRRDALREFVHGQRRTDPGLSPPSPEVVSLVSGSEPVLSEIVDLLEASDPPRWEVDLSAGFDAALPSFIDHLALHHLLVAGAGEAARQGDPSRAESWLDASWRLRSGIAEDPRLIPQLIAMAQLEDELALLRALPDPLPRWRERLAGMPLRDRTEVALRLESWLLVQALRDGWLAEELDQQRIVQHLSRPLLHRGVAGQDDFIDRCVIRLRSEDLRTFDNERFYEQEVARIPRWNVIARLLAPNYLESWVKAAHAELGVDLTRRTIEVRETLRQGDFERLEELAGEHSSVVEGIRWVYRIEPEEVVIETVAEIPRSSKHPLPLAVRLDRSDAAARCAREGSG